MDRDLQTKRKTNFIESYKRLIIFLCVFAQELSLFLHRE